MIQVIRIRARQEDRKQIIEMLQAHQESHKNAPRVAITCFNSVPKYYLPLTRHLFEKIREMKNKTGLENVA